MSGSIFKGCLIRIPMITEKDLKTRFIYIKYMKIKILGSGQDGGIPHTGCYCEICNIARKDPNYQRLGSSISILDDEKSICYIIDTSWDFKYQLDMLREDFIKTRGTGRIPINGILLTHAHLGHCSGLWHLGKESLGQKNVLVFCTSKMAQMLRENYPFKLLVQENNIEIKEIQPGGEFELEGFSCKSILVPHRNEVADTVGFIIKTKKKVIYLPDIDHWTDEVIDEIKSSDIAIIDGTFFTKDEVPRFDDIPHPPNKDTIDILKDVKTEIFFTHINHTNPINKEGLEKKEIEEKGFKIAYDGLEIEI
jgi:pyrroloquinoline quinone biosynthesis protein B